MITGGNNNNNNNNNNSKYTEDVKFDWLIYIIMYVDINNSYS